MATTSHDAHSLTASLKREAHALGFALAGACPAVTPRGFSRLHDWLAAGYAGEMRYLADRLHAYEHPTHVLDGARSLLMLAMSYRTCEPAAATAGQGRVARYAWGLDYHDLIHQRLRRLAARLVELAPDARVRGVVDSAPLMEREFAQLAGLGWIGKNTLVLNKQLGSWFFLAVLLTDVELAYDEPHAAEHCGTCRACLDACPTGAFVDAYVLDSRKCISYQTIEHRAQIPAQQRPAGGDWLFGCDICQEVCPWNHHAPVSAEGQLHPLAGMNPVELAALFELDEAAFRQRFRRTPLWRPKRRGLLRNAAIVLGNQRAVGEMDALTRGLNDDDAIVRGASAWALGQLETREARAVLAERLEREQDADVRDEIVLAVQQGT